MSSRRRYRWAWAALALAVGGGAVASCDDDDGGGAGPAATEPTTTEPASAATDAVDVGAAGFLFGFLGPGAGLLDEIAVAQERALALAVADINGAGGVLGEPVGAVTVQEAPDAAIDDSVAELLDRGADVVLGPLSSDSASALLPSLAERGLVGCSASATLAGLTAGNDGNSFFRTALADDLLVSQAADELEANIEQFGVPPDRPFRVVVMARGDDYGTAVGNGLASELVARGFDASVEGYHPRTVIFTAEVDAVVPTDPDLIVVVAYEEAPLLLSTLVEAGYPADRIAGLDGLFVPRLAEQTFPSDPSRLDGISILATSGDRAFTERLIQQPGQQQVVYGAQMYDCAVVTALAVTVAGSRDPAVFGAEMREVTQGGRACSSYRDCVALASAGEDIDYDGPTGRIALDDFGDITAVRFTVASFDGGQFVERRSIDVDFTERRRTEAFTAAVFVTRLQQALKALGYYEGEITGIFDDATEQALRALQRDLGVPETGEYDEATDAALRALLGAKGAALTASVAEIQQLLTDLGYYTGPVDGVFTTETADAIRALQRTLGVPETGIIDAATLRAIYAAGVASVPPPPPPPDTTVPPTTAPPTTATPTTPPTDPPTTPDTTTPDRTIPDRTSPESTAAPTTTTTKPPPPSTTTTKPPPPSTTTTKPPPGEPDEGDIMDVLAADPRFSTLVALLLQTGYDEDLREFSLLTMFAPVNEAFAALPPGALDDLEDDPDRLAAVLAYHLVPELVTTADLVTGSLPTANGAPLPVVSGPGGVTVGGAKIVVADLTADNGVVHGIDTILVPPE